MNWRNLWYELRLRLPSIDEIIDWMWSLLHLCIMVGALVITVLLIVAMIAGICWIIPRI